IQLIVAGYALSFAVLLITGGRLGDLYGRRRLFVIGMTGFTIASALCGFARVPAELVGARVLQGAFAAVMVPQALSLIQVTFTHKEQSVEVLITPALRSTSGVMFVSPSATSLSRLTMLYSLRKIFVKPRLGMRRCSGIWPPSNPRIMRDPLRERWPLCPRV